MEPADRFDLSYGTNVHPAEDVAGLLRQLSGPAAAVRRMFEPNGVLGLGLWLPRTMAAEIADCLEAVENLTASRDETVRVRERLEQAMALDKR